MSGNENMNWDDDLDFESLADEHDAEAGAAERNEEFSDLRDLTYDDDPAGDEATVPESGPVIDEVGEDPTPPPRPAAPRPAMKKAAYKRRSGIPAVIMSLLFGLSTIAAGVAVGGAVVLVAGLDIRSLWNPEALFQVEPWLDLQNNPVHVLYLVGLGIVALTWLIGWRVHRFSRSANRNLRDTEEVLGKLISLRLDSDSAWQNPLFRKDPAVEAFVFEILGAWRLQVARQDKNLALEGELRRLEAAVSSNSREELARAYEHPVVERLADQMVRWHDEREGAAKEIDAVRSKDQHESGAIVGVIQDARSWNRHTLDQLGVQNASVERIARLLGETPEQDERPSAEAARLAQFGVALREIREQVVKLADSAAETASAVPSDGGAPLTELIDRGGKLAFQIAMEVASLGQRGERLLPMAQALEELTTEFRESAGQTAGTPNPTWTPDEATFQAMTRKIDGLIGLIDTASTEPSNPQPRTTDLAQVARKVAGDLDVLAGTFNHQAERLTGLGVSFAALTGTAFDPDDLVVGKPDNPPDGGLLLSQMDPFDMGDQKPEAPAEIDPFAVTDTMGASSPDTDHDPAFSTDVTPGLEVSFSSMFDDAPAIEPVEPQLAEPQAPETQAPETQAPAAAVDANILPATGPDRSAPETEEPALSSDEEPVYDLTDFGALPLDEPTASGEEDRIYDLAEFGAVGLD